MIIGMYTEGLKLGQQSLEEGSIGGSESAMIQMSREMSKLGHEVKFFCNYDSRQKTDSRRDSFGIDWYDVSEFYTMNMMLSFDVLFCYRFYTLFQKKINSKLNILVNHDMLAEPKQLMTYAWQIDHMFNLSKFHVDSYLQELPELKDFIWQTKNGVDLGLIDKSFLDAIIPNIPVFPDLEREERIVYASRPERGLERLLLMWPRIHELLPNAELAISSYKLDNLTYQKLPTQMVRFYEEIEALSNALPAVKTLGSLNKSDYWRLLRTSKVLAFPTHFPEISCINALEAMSCGTPVISTDAFALSETIGDKGILIKGNPDSKEYQDQFIGKLVQLMTNEPTWKQLSNRGREWVERQYQWKDIAKDWIDKVEEMLSTRFNRNKNKVYMQLEHNSDIIAMKKVAEKHNDQAIIEKVDKQLEIARTYKEEYSVGGYCILETDKEYNINPRFGIAIEWMRERSIRSVIDIGCHMGSFSISASNIIPDLKITGFDLSEQCIKSAEELKSRFAKHKENIIFRNFNILNKESLQSEKVDAVFAGEILEHLENTKSAISKFESCLKEDGWMLLTMPSGPWESISYKDRPERFHIHHFELADIKDLFGKKKNFLVQFVPGGKTHRRELLGWWVVCYQNSDAPTGDIDYSRKELTRPYQSLTFGMIVKNEEDNLSKCLKSVQDIVDDIIILDTGSTDDTLMIANKFTPNVYKITNNPDGDGKFNFGWARNQCLEKIKELGLGSDWFLWMDADEEMLYPEKLRKYLDAPIYPGYVIFQNHSIFDMKETKPDTPVRLFKLDKGIKFQGCIHEMPMLALNDYVHPSLILPDVHILHYGYTTEIVRRRKCADRNIPLLLKDRKLNPDRRISLVLLMRDYLNLTLWELEGEQEMSEKALVYVRMACEIFEKEFKYKKDDKNYGLAFALYQSALAHLGKHGESVIPGKNPPIQIAMTLAGSYGELSKESYDQNKFWFKDEEELREWMTDKREELFDKLSYPTKRRMF